VRLPLATVFRACGAKASLRYRLPRLRR